MLCRRVLIVTSAVCLYFSAVRIMCAPVVLPRIFAIRSSNSSAIVRRVRVTVTCLPVYSTCMVKAPFIKRSLAGLPAKISDCTSTANAALMGAWNPHIFAILRYGSAGDVDALRLQHACDQVISKWFAWIFFFNQLLHLAL